MPHPRKKGGVRKDKKTKKMREALEERQANRAPERPTTDQHDIQEQKPGSARDYMSPQHRAERGHETKGPR